MEVTLVAASVESVCVLGLLCRGRCYDRQNALLILPLLIQEWLQVILWEHMGHTATQCDGTNRLVSSLVTYLVCGVPAWISVQPLIFGELHAEHRKMAWSFLGLAVVLGSAGVLVQLGQSSKCTYTGPWRHQIWPVLHLQYDILPDLAGGLLGRLLSVGNLWLYGAASFGGFLTARPSYVLLFLAAVGVNAQVLILFLGPEWGSFWCFQASLLSAVALLEPYLFKKFGNLGALVPPQPAYPKQPEPQRLGQDEELEAMVP
eukprot:Skav225601  [mRNA]  locus=scaffold4226:11599:13349:- [translate_table: standard]